VQFRMRTVVVVLLIAQVGLPLVLMVLRMVDPSIGPQPFGWQMWSGRWQ
jgi:hypothetical protein